ncbi:MAG: renal dipeptidase family protein [Candidatus Aminicenantes bacterium]|nr:renal dipeptidase family protein [Candidatus Aminicenantes bacterium]
MMKRRDFICKGIAGTAGSWLFATAGKSIFSQEKTDLSSIAAARKGHPLYFDGLILSLEDTKNKEDFKDSGLSGFIWDVSFVEEKDGKYVRLFLPCLKSIARANRLLRENEYGLFLATKGSRVTEARQSGKTAVFLQFQSCEPFTDDLDLMGAFYELGLRICQVTHHSTNPFGGGSIEKEWTGLTDKGFKAIEKMNDLGIIPDLAHGNEVLCRDILKTSKKPVVASHTCCRAIVKNARCITDPVIKGVADSGGLVAIMPLSWWITNDPVPTVDHYLRHLEHVINVGGIDAVGLSHDQTVTGNLEAAKLNNDNTEAIKLSLDWWKRQQAAGILGFEDLPRHSIIPELNNVRRLFTIQAALERKGHTSAEIEKIMGLNWVRVLTQCL